MRPATFRLLLLVTTFLSEASPLGAQDPPLIPPTPHPQPTPVSQRTFFTDWAWLAAHINPAMDKYAKDLTDKYRKALEIPAGQYVDVEAWKSDGAVPITGPTQRLSGLSETRDLREAKGACFAAARAEFGARSQLLEAAFAQALGSWHTSVLAGGPAGTEAAWRAVSDLEALRPIVASQSGWMSSGKGLLAGVASGKVAGAITKEIDRAVGLADGDLAKVIEWLGVVVPWGEMRPGERLKEKLKKDLSSHFNSALHNGDPVAIDSLIEVNKRIGDALLLKHGFGAAAAVEELGAAEGFRTGFALKFNQESILGKRFGVRDATCVLGNPRAAIPCRLTATEMRTLAAGGTVEVTDKFGPNAARVLRFGPSDIPQYAQLASYFREMDGELAAAADEGERKWFAAINSTDRVKQAAAMRMLSADIGDIVAADAGHKVKTEAINRLASRIADLTPPALALFKSAFKSMLKSIIPMIAEGMAPDELKPFTDSLDAASRRIATQLVPSIAPVDPSNSRFEALSRLLKPDQSQMPSSCVDVETPSGERATEAPKTMRPGETSYGVFPVQAGKWIDTGIRLKKGQHFRVEATGTLKRFELGEFGPDGYPFLGFRRYSIKALAGGPLIEVGSNGYGYATTEGATLKLASTSTYEQPNGEDQYHPGYFSVWVMVEGVPESVDPAAIKQAKAIPTTQMQPPAKADAGAALGGPAAPTAAPEHGGDPSYLRRTDLAGQWTWFNGWTVTLNEDGSFTSVPAGGGRWSVTDPSTRRIRMQWSNGCVDDLTADANSGVLDGRNQKGVPIRGERPNPKAGLLNRVGKILGGAIVSTLNTYGTCTQ